MTDRGVSVTVNYVLGLMVATLLITGLLYATGDMVGDRRESTTRGELRVVGEQMATDLATADRLAQTGATDVIIRVSAPDRINGEGYSVSLNATNRQIVVETVDQDVVVSVPVSNTTPVSTSSARGGDVVIVLTGGADEALEVRSS